MLRIVNVPVRFGKKQIISAERAFSFSRIHNKDLGCAVEPLKIAYTSYQSIKDDSTKEPIMIMHGLFGCKTNWNALSKAIHDNTGRKVITVDARNHGDSPHSPQMSYKYMCADIVQLINDLGFKKCILLGHSMGGSTMMYVALQYPQLVEKLIVVDMSPIGPVSRDFSGMHKIFEAMRSTAFDNSTNLIQARRTADKQLATTIQSKTLRQFLITNVIEAEKGKYQWRINLPVLERVFSTEIATFPKVEGTVYPGPTLFIGGSLSDYIKKEHYTGIKELFPKANIQYITGARHWVHADKPTEFINLVTTFVNQTHS